MGDKWSRMVKDHAFGAYGPGIAKVVYLGIEDERRFFIVKDALRRMEELENRLGDNGLEWPQE